MSISRAKFTSSYMGSVLIGGNLLKSLSIIDTEISNSPQFGIKLAPNGIQVVKVVSTKLEKNKQGIVINPMSSADFKIENSVINGSLLQGMFIYSDVKGVIRIVNSSVTNSGDRGLTLEGRYRHMFLNLLVNGSTFAWNKKGAVSCSNNYRSNPVTIQFQSNNFFHNLGPTVEIFEGTDRTSWAFLNNTFHDNRGFAVIALGTSGSFTGSQYRPAVVVRGNLFLANQCPDKAVIDIRRDASSFFIGDNHFESNLGRCLLLEGTAGYVPISMLDNVFNENNCEDNSVVETLRLDEDAKFANNTFTDNRAGTVVLLQVVHNIHSSLQRKELTFGNNTLSKNVPPKSSRSLNTGDPCTVVLSGILYYKETDFHFNKFNNSKYIRELCVRVPAITPRDVVNVTHNWWSTVIGQEVRDRIWDFDDNYDFAVANDWPFLLSSDDPTLTSLEQHDFKQRGQRLSGRLFESITLKVAHSPYIVTSDLTVLQNVTLTIEAGVTVKVSPRVSILVAGALQAHGNLTKPVLFTVAEPEGTNESSQLPIRLVDGAFPWEGRVEVFHNEIWIPIFASSNTFARNISDVICRQLGYGPPVIAMETSAALTRNVNSSMLMIFRCHGNETSLHDCVKELTAFNHSSVLTVVKCQGVPWGNLRFISSREINTSQPQSILQHVEFSHCGNRHGMAVPAIEAVSNTPKLQSITIRNCTSGGLRIHFPRADVHVNHSTFVNTGETGVSFLQTYRNILMESSESSRNKRGIVFEEPSSENVPRVHYGRVFLCSEEKVVAVKNQTLLYFDIPRLKNTMASETCQKVLTVPKGRGIKLTLLFYSGKQRIWVYDSATTSNLIVDKSDNQIATLVHKELFIPRDEILLQRGGDVNSKVAIQVEDINIAGELLCSATDAAEQLLNH